MNQVPSLETILKHVNNTEKNIKEHIYNENSMSEIALKWIFIKKLTTQWSYLAKSWKKQITMI